ncbi:asparagine synthase-related protein [Gammaproteobacteria bacterium]|nr:asparagine synthase-related protein [Gammaproteobacteria bacterium]
MELSQKDIRFLSFGYFLENSSPVDLNFSQNNSYFDLGYDECLMIAEDLWRSTFAERYEATKGMQHVVPISGGIDSRALLFELLKYKEAKEICTFTFGVKGTLDFDIGNEIAKYYGTSHHQMECNNDILTIDNAIQFGEMVDYSCNLFLTPQVSQLLQFKEMNIWSGTVIDVYFGRHFHDIESTNTEIAAQNFIRENTLSKYFEHMIDKHELIEVMDIPKLQGCSLEHVIDLANRQSKFVAKHLLYKGYNFSTMLGEEITEFALSINQAFHSKQKLYIDMMQNLYPNFNKHPCKTTFGMKLSTPDYQVKIKRLIVKVLRSINADFKDPYINYLDWEKVCDGTLMQNMSDAIGKDDYSELSNRLIRMHKKHGGYAMDILNLFSLRIINNEKK